MLSYGMNIDDYNFELLAAVERNDSAGVAFLLPKANPQHKHSLPFRKAAQLGHIECLKLLQPVSDPTAGNSGALTMAAANGHLECMHLLIPISDMQLPKDNVLATAAHHGNIHALQHLLPLSDPQTNHSEAFAAAVLRNHTECADILLPVSDVKAAFKKHNVPHDNNFIQAQKNLKQRKMLERAVGLHNHQSVTPIAHLKRKM